MHDIFRKVQNNLVKQGFEFERTDFNRPWGGFFVINEQQATQFINQYFTHLSGEQVVKANKVSPKILLVAPNKRLSWQYHLRRSEVWTVVEGKVGIIHSYTNQQTPLRVLQPGDTVTLQQGERHRLVGLDNWSIVAEIWRHTDPAYPSNEDDIVRLQDDYGRNSPVK